MSQLYPDDQNKVDNYLASNVNSVQRKPFKPLRLLGVIVIFLVAITLVSYFIAINHGVI